MWKKMGSRKYFRYSECTAGDVLVEDGVFVGTEQGKYGVIHVFMLNDQSEVVLNSSGQLNYLVDKYLSEGTRCRVVYGGKNKLTKGAMAGKEAHNFDVFVSTDGSEPKTSTDDGFDPNDALSSLTSDEMDRLGL